MSLLISTPCYGGMANTHYMKSILELQEQLLVSGVPHEFQFLTNESLIQRARNQLAHQFLKSPYDYHLWIDADIEFTPTDVGKLWQLQAPMAVGVYAMKKAGEDLYAAWIDGELVTDLSKYDKPMKVDYAGTGFMMVHRSTYKEIERLFSKGNTLENDKAKGKRRSRVIPSYINKEGEDVIPFFQTPVIDGVLESEDYFFCRMAREAGIDILMDPSVKLTHWGQFGYGQKG